MATTKPTLTDLAHKRFKALEQFLEQCDKSGRWLVLTHDNPDPDSLASAALLAEILRKRFKRRATVAYGGLIGRAENAQMAKTLKLKLSRVRHINWKHYRHFALVDAQPKTGNHQLPEHIVPDIVIDHHPLRRASQGVKHLDLRVDYGATASILAEYLLLSGLPISRNDATAIVYAVRSETLDFSRESPGPDRLLFDYFEQLADKRTLGKIQRPRLPQNYFKTLQTALSNLYSVDSLVVSHLGDIPQPDIVPETADLLLRMDGKTWSFCTGIYEDRIQCSIRTTNRRANAASLMRRLLGKRGKGGGHGMLAGGWIPAPTHPGEDDGSDRDIAERNLGLRLAKLLRKNPEKLLPLDL